MKVFENIDSFRRERLALAGIGENGMEFFTSELKRVITDLIPMRKSRQATEVYFHNNLCHDENVRKFEESIAERRLNGEDVQDDEYRPTKQECHYSEDILHTVLIRVLRDDRYSFGHLYWLLCSRYNRIAGFAYYNDIVISDKLIEYAVDFDVEELQKQYREAGDIVDRIDFLEIRLLESRSFDADPDDAVLTKLKNRFENVTKDMIDMTEKRLTKITGVERKSEGQVSEVPLIEDSVGMIESGQEKYLTDYDFTRCPIDVAQFPYSVHLGTYRIVRTQRGLEDSHPILKDILRNIYKQVCYTEAFGAQGVFDATRDLLKSLFSIYIKDAYLYCDGDFDGIYIHLKWWAMHTINCLDAAFDKSLLPQSDAPIAEDSVKNERANAWQKCDFFRKSMSEFCLYLVISALKSAPFNPYKRVYGVIPFNYYGEDYRKTVDGASRKKVKNQSDKCATEYLENSKQYRKFLEKRLTVLDKKYINDPETVTSRNKLIEDILGMANDYLVHLEEVGITDAKTLKFAFELWDWFQHQTMTYLLAYKISQCDCSLLPYMVSSKEEEKLVLDTKRHIDNFRKSLNVQLCDAKGSLYNVWAKEIVGDKTTSEENENASNDSADEHHTTNNNRTSYSPHWGTTINTEVIYSLIKDIVKTELSLQDFEDAIKYADFSKLAADGKKKRVKDYPLAIITKIKEYFDKDWYDACCESLGLTAQRVSGYHRDGTMGKIDYRFPSNLTK